MIQIEKCFENFSETRAIKGKRLDLGKKIKGESRKPWCKLW
jgi:hypothetical protein